MNFIEDVVERFPAARPALIEVAADGSRRMHHFGELFARSAGLSGAFAARGVGRGDVVMTLLGSRPEWVLTMLACWRMGAVVLPCNTQLRRKDLELRARAAGPRLCVGESRYLGELPDGLPYMDVEELARVFDEDLDQESPAAIADLSPTDPAAIVFTSGTTGEPRGVVYPQRYLAGQGLQAEHWFGAREGDVAWCTAAPGWAKSTRNAFIAPWARGAVAVLHDARFDPAERLRLCDELGVNVLCQAPTEYRMLAKRGELAPVKSLRRLVSAGEPIEPDVIRLFRERLGLPVADGYGQTETGAISGTRPGEDDPDRDGSMGRPLPGLQTRIEDGRAAAARRILPHLLRPLPRRQPLRGRVVADRRPGPRGRRRLPLVRGPQRRSDPLLRLPDRPLRGRVGARLPPRRRRGGRGRRARPRARLGRPRGRRPPRRQRALRAARRGAAGPRQGPDRALQVPADRRVRGGAAEDQQRQDPAGGAAGQLGCGG